MLQKIRDISSKDFSGGLNTISDFFSLKPNESPDSMDVKFNFDGSMQKRPGCLKKNTSYLTTGSGFGAFELNCFPCCFLRNGLLPLHDLHYSIQIRDFF